MKLESADTVVLELDIQRSAAQNVYNDSLWSLLLRVAREGRLAAVLGAPPCRTMSVLRHRPGGPRPVRSPAEPLGLSTRTPSERELVDHDGVVCSHAVVACHLHGRKARASSTAALLVNGCVPTRTAPAGREVHGSRKPVVR